MVYLSAKIAGDGDQKVTIKHRCAIARGRFVEHRRALTSTKLPTSLRLRLYAVLVISTMVYGADAWLFTQKIRKSLNGVSSKMLSSVTRRSIHEEAWNPSFDAVGHVLKRRRAYLRADILQNFLQLNVPSSQDLCSMTLIFTTSTVL